MCLVHLLVSLVVIVRILRVLHTVGDKFLKSALLTYKFDEFGDTACATQHNQLFLLEQELLDRAAFLLTQKLIDFHVASIAMKEW